MKIQLLPKSLLILTLGVLTLPVALYFFPQSSAFAQGGQTAGALTVTDSLWQTESVLSFKAH